MPARPGASRRSRRRRGGARGDRAVRGQEARASTSPATQNGTLTQNIQASAAAKDQAADHRAEDRAEHRGQADDRHVRPRPGRPPPACDRRHQRHMMPPPTPCTTRKAIRLPRSTPGSTAPSRRGTPRARPSTAACRRAALRPAGDRDRDAEREQVAGRDPLDRGHRGVNSSPSVCSATLTIVVSNSTAMPPTSTVHAVRHTAGSTSWASVYTSGHPHSFRYTLYPKIE